MTATLIEYSHEQLHQLERDHMSCQAFVYSSLEIQRKSNDEMKQLGEKQLPSSMVSGMEYDSCSDESDESDCSDSEDPSPEFDYPMRTMDLSTSQTNLLPKRIKSVTWAGSVVTDVFFRPKVTMQEKRELFYDSVDMQRCVLFLKKII